MKLLRSQRYLIIASSICMILSGCGPTQQLEFQGITYENLSIAYDGSEHELLIDGQLPSNGSVTYYNNKRTQLGISQAVAVITAAGYKSLTLEADLEILKSFSYHSNITFEDKTVTYDGFPHILTLDGDIPSGVQVHYSSNREDIVNSATAVGSYEISAHLSGGGFFPTTLTANLIIQSRPAHMTQYLFVGDSFFDPVFYTNYSTDWANVPKTDNIAVGGTTIDYWQRHIDEIEQKDPENIILNLGINDINAGMANMDVVFKLTTLFDMLWSRMPDLNIYWISINPNTSFASYAAVWTFVNNSIADYELQFPRLKMIDFASKMYSGNQLVKSFLKDGLHLSNSGYILLNNMIKENLGILDAVGDNFGEVASLGVSSGFNLAEDNGVSPQITSTTFNESQAYLKNSLSSDFYATTQLEILASGTSNKPVAGLSVANVFSNILFYIDASNSSSVKAGTIKRYDEELWDYAIRQEVAISSASKYKLEVVKNGNDFYYSVNGVALIKTSGLHNLESSDEAVVGAYTIGTRARYSEYSFNFSSGVISENTPQSTLIEWNQGEYDDWTNEWPIAFGSAKNTGSYTGDDMYAQVTRTSTHVNIAIRGYGDFTSDEQINIVLNDSPYPTRVWNLGTENLYFKVCSDGKIYYLSDLAGIFTYQTPSAGTYHSTIQITRSGKYFTMTLSLNISSFPFLIAHPQFELALLQSNVVGSTMTLYNGINGASVARSMILYGKERGDLAVSSNYVYVEESGIPKQVTKEVKDSAVVGYPISFSNPVDIQNESGNDYYAKITRLGTYFEMEVLAFGEFKSDEYIKMVMHVGADSNSVWGLNPDDTVFKITRNGEVFFRTNQTEYFQWSRLDPKRDPKLSQSHYSFSFSYHEDGYSVMTLIIPDLSIFGALYSDTFKLLLAQWNMDEAGDTFLNVDPYTDLMRLNGSAKGDPAMQRNYLTISNTGTIS